MTDLTQILNEITNEYERSMLKHKAFNSSHEGYAVLKEELEELWDEVKVDNFEKQRNECIQVGAMAVKYLVMLARKNEPPEQKCCEWRDDTDPLEGSIHQISSCGFIIDYNDVYKFCPYCGKPIKEIV